ncbi:hypothetical protein GF374_03560 [Candidatus Woesearchaeota archaeon]|nr:hypothetical protein [Candidatus Woesearchaeota archaeon]
MEFIDVWAGEESPKKRELARRLGIRLAPGDYSLLLSKDKRELKQKRPEVDFVAAKPGSKQEMNALLTDTRYDFLIVQGFNVGKRNVRMAKRYETAIAVPVAPAFSLRIPSLARTRRNLMRVEKYGGELLICSGAEDPSQLRSGRDLAAIGAMLGLRPDYAKKAVRHRPSAILERNRRRKESGIPEVGP